MIDTTEAFFARLAQRGYEPLLHKSADLFALRLILAKGTFSPGTWPRFRSQRTLFVSRSADCWRRSGELGQQQQASPSAIDEHLPTFAP